MKKFIYSFLALALVFTNSSFAAGYLASYSVKVSDPAAYVEAMDELMSTKWGKSFPAAVSIHQYAFNGYDDATHVVILNYENPENLGKGTNSFSDPVFLSFLATTSSIAEPIEQALNMKLISGGDQDPAKNNAYTIFRMQVKDPGSYASAYSELIKAQEEAGNINGSYGLRQLVGGDTRYYTHYAYTSAANIGEAMASAEVLYSSDAFSKFAKKVGDNRRLMNISILQNVTNYNTN
tara:strand:- start:610 stop:1317 length:708 start_codon:yes stop_codon:yes gene_type:complete